MHCRVRVVTALYRSVLFGLGCVGFVIGWSATASEVRAQQRECTRCQAVSKAGTTLSTGLQRLQEDRNRTLRQVEDVDKAIAALTTDKDRNERAVSQMLRERRNNRDVASLPGIESRLRQLSEQTADLDRKMANELDRKAQYFERITWLNAVIDRFRSETQAVTRLTTLCRQQCLPTETGQAGPDFVRILQRELPRIDTNECTDCSRFVREVNNLVGRIESERRTLSDDRADFNRTNALLNGADADRDAALDELVRTTSALGRFEDRDQRPTLDARIIRERSALESLTSGRTQILARRSDQFQNVLDLSRRIGERIDAYDALIAQNRTCVGNCRGTPVVEVGPEEKPDPDAGKNTRNGRAPISTPNPNAGDDGKSQDRLGERRTATAPTPPAAVVEPAPEQPVAPRITQIEPPIAPKIEDDGELGRPQIARTAMPPVQRRRSQAKPRVARRAPPEVVLPERVERDEIGLVFPETTHGVRARFGGGILDLPGGLAAFGGDLTLDAWSVEVSGTTDVSGLVGAVALGEWEIRVTRADDEQWIFNPNAAFPAGSVAFAAPGGSILAFAGPGAAPLGYSADFTEVRGEFRVGSPAFSCLDGGGECRSGFLVGLQTSEFDESVRGTTAMGASTFAIDNELSATAAVLGIFANFRQPLGMTPFGPATFELDADAFVKFGVADADSRLSINGVLARSASDTHGFVGVGAELDAQIAFDLGGLTLAFGGRVGAETEPSLAFDGAGALDLTDGTRLDAQVYIEGKIRF